MRLYPKQVYSDLNISKKNKRLRGWDRRIWSPYSDNEYMSIHSCQYIEVHFSATKEISFENLIVPIMEKVYETIS